MCCLRWGERQLGLRDKPFRESIPHPIRPLPTLRTPRYRDARRARSRPACRLWTDQTCTGKLIPASPNAPRIRLSDKTSRLHPQHVVPQPAQAYEPEVPVKVREWISSAPASADLVLEAQPPAQPHSCVVVERPIRFVADVR